MERVAHVLRLGGDFSGSMATWEALLKMAPNSEAGIVGLADVFIQTAAYERGAARIRELISKQAKPSAASQFWHAELLWLMNERKEAREMYEKVPARTRSSCGRSWQCVSTSKTATSTSRPRRPQTARSIDAENLWVYTAKTLPNARQLRAGRARVREAIRRAEKEPQALPACEGAA